MKKHLEFCRNVRILETIQIICYFIWNKKQNGCFMCQYHCVSYFCMRLGCFDTILLKLKRNRMFKCSSVNMVVNLCLQVKIINIFESVQKNENILAIKLLNKTEYNNNNQMPYTVELFAISKIGQFLLKSGNFGTTIKCF